MKRIALFFDRPYIDAHSCFTELAKHLSKSGFYVDLYYFFNAGNQSPSFYDPQIRVFNFPRSKFGKVEFWYKLLFVKDFKYCAAIGTPFEGVFLAQKVAKLLHIPYIYLADEVFNPALDRHHFQNYVSLKEKDIKANRQAAATIALGHERYIYQMKINRLGPLNKHFIIPNSPSGKSVQLRSNYFRDIFGIEDQKPIVLFIGTLGWNLAKQLYETSKQFKDKPYHLIFHTRSLGQMGQEEHPFIKISKTPVNSNMLNFIVSSADIGLVLYDKDSIAEKENALTGGKIGTYLINNLPLIVGNIEELKVLESKGVAVYIDDINGIDQAVQKIIADKSAYKRNIEKIYPAEYDYSIFYKPFETFLNEIIK